MTSIAITPRAVAKCNLRLPKLTITTLALSDIQIACLLLLLLSPDTPDDDQCPGASYR